MHCLKQTECFQTDNIILIHIYIYIYIDIDVKCKYSDKRNFIQDKAEFHNAAFVYLGDIFELTHSENIKL